MSETKSSNDNTWLIVFVALIPLWMYIIMSSGSDNEYDLLTEEQKLEKQKELALQKEQAELKKQQEAEWWDEQISYVVVDKPPIVVFAVGAILLLGFTIFAKSRCGRSWWDEIHYRGFWGLFNMQTMFMFMAGFLFLMWVTGFGVFGDVPLFGSQPSSESDM